jgi:pimeloyl-ACP methyl ester carboxylesterase
MIPRFQGEHPMSLRAMPACRVGVCIEGSGPPVVLLHSSMSSKSQWRKLVKALRDSHRLISIDLYGYGDTAWPRSREAFRLDDEVSLVENNAYRGAARFIDYWNGPSTFDQMPPRRQMSLIRLLPKTALDFQAVARERPSIAAYRRMQTPTCLIAGRRSPRAARSLFSALGEILPRAACHEVAAGHMAPVTHPELVNPIIAGFVRTFDAVRAKAA